MPIRQRLKTILELLVAAVLPLTIAILISQGSAYDDQQTSAEGRLRQYYGGEFRAQSLYPPATPEPSYPTNPGDYGPIYPGDEKWDGNYAPNQHGLVFDLASNGSEVYVVSHFDSYINSYYTQMPSLARWDGYHWNEVVPPSNPIYGNVTALAVKGSDFYVGGDDFQMEGLVPNNIAHWDGTQWDGMAGGVTNGTSSAFVNDIAVGGSDIYVVGNFYMAGSVPVKNIARWDGAQWHDVGGGVDGVIEKVVVSGSDVYVGGSFTQAGGASANNIARWDGVKWSTLGSGMDASVLALAFQNGSLYAGGYFAHAGSIPANHVARWDGSQWNEMSSGLPSVVTALAADSAGVYAGGPFDLYLGDYGANHVAYWNGSAWTNLGSGIRNTLSYWEYAHPDVKTILVDGDQVLFGGNFSYAGGNFSSGLATYHHQATLGMLDSASPAAPGTQFYWVGEYLPPNTSVTVLLNDEPLPTNLTTNSDGKLFFYLRTNPLAKEGTYTLTVKCGQSTFTNELVLDHTAPLYDPKWDGGSAPYMIPTIYMPLLRR